MSRRVLASDPHRPVDLSAQLASEMSKRRGQGRNIWRPTLGLVDQGGDEAVPAWPGREHHMPRLDIGVRWRILGQGKGLTPTPAAPAGPKTAVSNGAL
jgi:hypothetical protein